MRPRFWYAVPMDVVARVTLVVTAGLLLMSCAPREDVLAQVGNKTVKLDVFQTYLGAVTGEAWEVVDDRVASRLLDQFLDQEVVAEAARGRSAATAPIEPARRSATVRGLLDQLCGEVPELQAARVEEAVARRLETALPARALVRQLLVPDLEQAEIARERLSAGEDFLIVSQEMSLAANAHSGGELGMIVQGTLPPEMDDVIFDLEEGEISRPVEGQAGLHLFQVQELVGEGHPSRDQVEPAVRRELGEAHAREHMSTCMAQLSQEVGVRVFPDHLWFRYEGKHLEEQNAAD